MMNDLETIDSINNLKDWKITAHFSVGGFEWLGFSESQPNKMVVISAQKNTIVDCDNGEIEECEIDYDEQDRIAVCEKIPNEFIRIAGQFGGELPVCSNHGEKIRVETKDNITTVIFTDDCGNEIILFDNYGYYICGFNYNYFVLSDDGGIIVAKKSHLFE